MGIKVYRLGELLVEINHVPGENLLQLLSANDIFLDAPCGGRGKCGKCKVRLTPDGEEVKACQTPSEDNIEIYLPEEMKMTIAGQTMEVKASTASSGDFGVAFDIGTTTVVGHLINLENCERVATVSGVNAQRPYGADVISRIEYSAEKGHETLSRLIQTQINGLVEEACRNGGISNDSIKYVTIAGNTIMQHLAAGYSPVGMGTVPFRPVSLFGEELAPWKGFPGSPDAKIYFAPCISSYVGGDITVGILACDMENDEGPTMFIDIGTNGEMALKVGDKYYCCATAAGPAFEGAEISRGMAAVPGAVSHIKWTDKGLDVTVLGEVAPDGICGSGLLDTLAMLLDTGAVDETGRILSPEEIDHPIAEYIGTVDGKNAFFISEERNVYLSAMDVRKLQLAKAAIAGGIQTLLITAELSADQIKLFLLGGGFGNYLDKNSAARIGLFPKEFLKNTKSMGNTAGEGSALSICSEDNRNALRDIRNKCDYIELSDSLVFNEQFVEQMMFDY